MSNSSYFYNKMIQYQNEIKELNEEKGKYVALAPKLNELSSQLPNLGNKLSESEECYKNGGFMSGGETYDRGILNKCYTKINNDSSTVQAAANSVNNKIIELEDKIAVTQTNLENVTNLYYNALKEEREGE